MNQPLISRIAKWLSLGVVVLVLPSVVGAQGICERMCTSCYSGTIIEGAGLDGCSVSAQECYFLSSTECDDCP